MGEDVACQCPPRHHERTKGRRVSRIRRMNPSIPIVGILFRSSNITRQHRELIIFVTPRLVSEMATK